MMLRKPYRIETVAIGEFYRFENVRDIAAPESC
jgi:hypothetical protein